MRKPKSVNVALGCNCWPPTAAVAVTVGQTNRQSEVCSKKTTKRAVIESIEIQIYENIKLFNGIHYIY